MRSRYKPWAIEYLKNHTENEFFLDDQLEEDKINKFISEKDTSPLTISDPPNGIRFIFLNSGKFPLKGNCIFNTIIHVNATK